MQLRCEPGAVIRSQGQGSSLLISAPDVAVEGCTLRDWGSDLTAMDSAVFVLPAAPRALIRNNRMQGPGFGVFVDGAADVQVIGIPDSKYGEEVAAWVKLHPDQVLTAEALAEYCKGRIAHFKVPRHFRFVEEFPMTVTGKVQKFRMRELMQAELAPPLRLVGR